MRWPFKPHTDRDPVIACWDGETFAYVVAHPREGAWHIDRAGVWRGSAPDSAALAKALQPLGLKGQRVHLMLRPSQYQFLQIEAPAVPDEELRAAARYQVRDMLDAHADDMTLDVLRVGDGSGKGAGLLFVVAAPTATVRAAMDLAQAMQWSVDVIDVQETAQRNLQSALAQRQKRVERADATLSIGERGQALLTISAKAELFFTRRIELAADFLTLPWTQDTGDTLAGASGGGGAHPTYPAADAYLPVAEYVPADAPIVDYSHSGYPAAAEAPTPSAHPEAQRLVVEVQRSLDLWDRSWSQWPLAGLQVSAGARSAELADWLRTETGLGVQALDLGAVFNGLDAVAPGDWPLVMPLLGLLLRDDSATTR